MLDEYLNWNGHKKPKEASLKDVPPVYENKGFEAKPLNEYAEEYRQPKEPDASDYNQLFRDKGYVGAFRELYKQSDWDKEERLLKRERGLSLLGDIAHVGLQGLASAFGARQFKPLESKVPEANERLRRLRDTRRGYEVDYAGKVFNAAVRDYEKGRAEALARQKMENDAKEAAAKRAFDLYLFGERQKAAKAAGDAKLEETKRHNKEMERLSGRRIGSKEDKNAVTFIGRNGAYRFKDKDIAYGLASRAVNMIRRAAQDRIDSGQGTEADRETINTLNESFFNSNNKDQVLEFVRQTISKYPEVEMLIANDPDVVVRENGGNATWSLSPQSSSDSWSLK